MFTFSQFTEDRTDLDARRRIMVAEFVDTDKIHTHKFEFTINEKPEIIKQRVNQYLEDELNFVPEPITDLTLPTETPKTAEELEREAFEAAKAEWLQKKTALATMIEDMQKGRELGTTPDETQIAIMQGLATWVNENMKQEYYF